MYTTKTWTLCLSTGACDDCRMLNGAGFNRHPTDCSMFIHCVFGESGLLRFMYQKCPFGQYWNHDLLTCQQASAVNCPMGMLMYIVSFCLINHSAQLVKKAVSDAIKKHLRKLNYKYAGCPVRTQTMKDTSTRRRTLSTTTLYSNRNISLRLSNRIYRPLIW